MKTVKYLVISIAVIFLIGCGGGSGDPKNNEASVTLSDEEKIKKLEDTGEIPANLDRTSSLSGIDDDKNGIRDDIDKYISLHYKDKNKRAAVTQLAKSLQSILLSDKSDTVNLKKLNRESMRAIKCIHKNNFSKSPVTDIQSLTTNTKKRLLEYLKYSKALDGTVMSLPQGDTCE